MANPLSDDVAEVIAAVEAAIVTDDCELCGLHWQEHEVFHDAAPEGRQEGKFYFGDTTGFYCPIIDCPGHTTEEGPHHSPECCYYDEEAG